MKTSQTLGILRTGAQIMYFWAFIRALYIVTLFVRNFNPPAEAVPYNSVPNGLYYLRTHELAGYVNFLLLALVMVGLNLLLWKTVKDVLEKIRLDDPFTRPVSSKISNISYILLGGWLVILVGEFGLNYIRGIRGIERVLDTFVGFDSDMTYLLCAGVVYIVAQIFRHGVELQQEKELTI